MQNLPWLAFVEVIPIVGLGSGKHSQGGGSQLGQIWQRLEARDDAVAAEQRHEPGQPSRWQCRALADVWRQSQRPEVTQAGVKGAHQRGEAEGVTVSVVDHASPGESVTE